MAAVVHSLAPGFPMLERIGSPRDLRRLPPGDLPHLADELRGFLIREVAATGGHLAAGLGTVELAIALHFVYLTPRDAVIWDVGHQAYPHKVLTGRGPMFGGLRRKDGISGFLRREESQYDAFGAGHSSTSISAALGMAIAGNRHDPDFRSVAVIGDGGLTAGLAYEALNHAGASGADLLVILNDNGMSISRNVGALHQSLGHEGADGARDLGPFFSTLGFRYSGPIDGHDTLGLVEALREARRQGGPKLLHVVTRKGNGYIPAESDPIRYHGVTPFDPRVGITGSGRKVANYTDVFSDWLCDMAERDPRIVAVTPAMREGSGLVRFAERFPDRYFDVGIAEQHCVTFAAGLACQGLRPVVAIYSTFLQRGLDQVIHDVALQSLPVTFAIDRGGLVGPDGATHNGSYDLAFLRTLPGMTVLTPSSAVELRDMLFTAVRRDGPVAVRYPRCAAAGPTPGPGMTLMEIGKSRLLRQGNGMAFLTFGTLLATVMEVAEALDASVYDMRSVKPLDQETVLQASRQHDLLVTVEEGAVSGGAGSAVSECLALHGVAMPVLHLGLPDRFIDHGTREEVLEAAGLDRAGILVAVADRLVNRQPGGPSGRDSRGTLREAFEALARVR
ncbi:MAG: 1-deoxy-D-xylulose-5-phosphate synthase [Steroidobacteraceae bacterium]